MTVLEAVAIAAAIVLATLVFDGISFGIGLNPVRATAVEAEAWTGMVLGTWALWKAYQ